MTKLLAIATALTFAFSATVSTVQAGSNGVRLGIGIGVGALAIGAIANSAAERSEAREHRERRKVRSARREREEKAPVRSAKKSSKSEAKEVAAVEPQQDVSNEASSIAAAGGEAFEEVITGSANAQSQPENSSIALTSVAVDSQPAPVKAAAKPVETASQQTPKSIDCKKFFPSVGMTLSVPCE